MSDNEHCCGSDCVGCETFAKVKALKKKRLEKKNVSAKPSKEDILWSR